jgi:hypothetical protein
MVVANTLAYYDIATSTSVKSLIIQAVCPDWAKFCCFGYFLIKQYLHFQLNKQLQIMVCCTYFNNQKELNVDVLDFQFEGGYFGYSLGYITKYWANFCSLFWSL